MMMIPENVIAKNSFYTLLTKIFPKHPNHDLDVKQAGKKKNILVLRIAPKYQFFMWEDLYIETVNNVFFMYNEVGGWDAQ